MDPNCVDAMIGYLYLTALLLPQLPHSSSSDPFVLLRYCNDLCISVAVHTSATLKIRKLAHVSVMKFLCGFSLWGACSFTAVLEPLLLLTKQGTGTLARALGHKARPIFLFPNSENCMFSADFSYVNYSNLHLILMVRHAEKLVLP